GRPTAATPGIHRTHTSTVRSSGRPDTTIVKDAPAVPRRLQCSRRTTQRRGRVLAGSSIAVVVLLLFTACTAGPSTRPAIVQHHESAEQQHNHSPQQTPPSLPPLQEAPENSVDWRDCDRDTRHRLTEHDGLSDALDVSCA